MVLFLRRWLTISERPIRLRLEGTAREVVGTRSGGGNLVVKRTRTCLEASVLPPLASISLTVSPSPAFEAGAAGRRRDGGGRNERGNIRWSDLS